MYKILNRLFLFFIFFIPHLLLSQILPKEGGKLNYRLIGFSFPADKQPGNYKIEIAEGSYTAKESFERHIIKTVACTTNKKIIEVPSFGKEYTWRVVHNSSSPGMNNSLHHFSTLIFSPLDTNSVRLKVLKEAEKFKDAYVFFDDNSALYDMAGSPVWFLDTKGLAPMQMVRDLKLSPAGTITFLQGDKAYEINYSGEILWKGPDNGIVSGDGTEHYHHQLDRLKNGHYMVLGNEPALCMLSGSTDTGMHILYYSKAKWESDSTAYKKISMGTVIEYDQKGKVVWYWKSSKYFIGPYIDDYKSLDRDNQYYIDTHENSFFFDAAGKVVYVSFRNADRIIKVKYPEGNVLDAYGEKYKPGEPFENNRLFCGQHSCLHSQDGSLLLYNNNSCQPGSIPSIIAIDESIGGKEGLKKIWEYRCTTEDSSGSAQMKYSWPNGGNIMELPDSSIFACMGGIYSKLFIVSKDKKVLWSALPVKWSETEKKWLPNSGYRASIITSHKALESLIWGKRIKE